MEFIEVFQPEGEYGGKSIALLDSWISLRLSQSFTKASMLILEVMVSRENLDTFSPGNYILADNCFFVIQSVSGEEETLTVEAVSLSYFLSGRLLGSGYIRYGDPLAICYDMVVRFKGFPEEFLSASYQRTIRKKVRYQKSYGEVLACIEDLCDTYDFGFEEEAISYARPSCHLYFHQGRDVSSVVEFNEHYDNLREETFRQSTEEEKTTAIVLGEGEGEAREKVIVGDEVKGLARKELYVDARDLQKKSRDGVVMDDTTYQSLLYQRGEAKLSEYKKVLTLSGTVDAGNSLFLYGRDYRLGDIVTLRSEKYGLWQKARLTQIDETWDADGYHIDTDFGQRGPTIIDKLKRR